MDRIDKSHTIAEACIDRGWSPVPNYTRTKKPKVEEWQRLRITREHVSEFFDPSDNVGVLLGDASGGLTDIDLDCPESVALRDKFLPTTLESGRNNRVSHLWYVSEGIGSEKFKDIGGSVLMEIRAKDDMQTIVHGIHESGKAVGFINNAEPREIDRNDLREACNKLATATLIARHLPDSGRHDLALAYAGFLLPQMEDEQEVYEILEAAWSIRNPSHDAFDDIHGCIRNTREKIDGDEPYVGGGKLEEELPGVRDRIKKFWRWDRKLTPREVEEKERKERVKRAVNAWENPEVPKIAKSRDILDKFHRELKASGVVGEERLIKLLFLAGHSRLLDRPLSLIIKGPSSTGKSYVIEQALTNPQPDHAVKFFTSMSERALIYSEEDYRHRIIVIAEQAGVNSDFLDYTLRTLLSEGRIEYETVIEGQHVKKSKEGPTGLVLATTRANLYHDNETRAVSVWTTDTQEQTAAIMEATADEDRTGMDFGPWKAFGTWVEGQHNEVWIPFARALSKQIRSMHVRQRRDFKLLLNAIKTFAIMHQANRERDYRGRIVATLRDYAVARELLNDLLSQGIGATVSKETRETVLAVKELTKDADHIPNKAVAEHLGLDKSSVSTRVNKALADGYLVNLQEPGKRGNKLAAGSDLPDDVSLLPEPHDMARVYINQEIATVCNIVGRLDANQGVPLKCPWFETLVGRLVGLSGPTNVSVQTLEKPYDEEFGVDRGNPEGEEHGEPRHGGHPPNAVQPSNHVTKSPEYVSSSGGKAFVQPTNPTKVQTCAECGIRPVWHGGTCKPCSDLQEAGAETDPPMSLFHDCDSCGEEREFNADAFGDYQCIECGDWLLNYEAAI